MSRVELPTPLARPEVIAAWIEAHWESPEALRKILRHPGLQPQHLVRLWAHRNLDIKAAVISRRECPEEVLGQAAEKVRGWVGKASTPPRLLFAARLLRRVPLPEAHEWLFEEGRRPEGWAYFAHIALAWGEGVPGELLERVYRSLPPYAKHSPHEGVYRALAHAANTPGWLLAELAVLDAELAQSVGRHPNCPPGLLESLAEVEAIAYEPPGQD